MSGQLKQQMNLQIRTLIEPPPILRLAIWGTTSNGNSAFSQYCRNNPKHKNGNLYKDHLCTSFISPKMHSPHLNYQWPTTRCNTNLNTASLTRRLKTHTTQPSTKWGRLWLGRFIIEKNQPWSWLVQHVSPSHPAHADEVQHLLVIIVPPAGKNLTLFSIHDTYMRIFSTTSWQWSKETA